MNHPDLIVCSIMGNSIGLKRVKLFFQLSENEDETMMREFQSLLETLLQYITHVTSVMNSSSDKPTAKFWRALQHKVHDLLDKVRYL